MDLVEGQSKKFGPPDAVVHRTNMSIYVTVRRTFALEGQISVEFDYSNQKNVIKPMIRVQFPALNKTVVQAAAFQHLVSELVTLATTLQVQIDELEITP